MNQDNKDLIIDRLKINDDEKCIIINQVTNKTKAKKDDRKSNHRFMSYKERGLSRSRNHALDNAKGDVCLIADDDCSYVNNYEKIVNDAYEKYPDADIIAFDFIRADGTKKTMREGRVGFLYSMKISSVQTTFRRNSVKKSGVKFDEKFGAGSDGPQWGEENIFLFDCLRAGLKIYYVPVTILRLQNFGSTWDRSNTPERYKQWGAIFYRMSPSFWRILILQFTLRKRKIYGKDMSGLEVYRYMMEGAKDYKKGGKDE